MVNLRGLNEKQDTKHFCNTALEVLNYNDMYDYSNFKNIIEKHEYKKINEELKPFIGIFDLEMDEGWFESTKGQMRSFFYETTARTEENNIKYEEVKRILDTFDKGYIIDSYGRKAKVMKWFINQHREATTKNFIYEDMQFYRHYQMQCESINDSKLVITNSIPSIIGMSSFAPDNPNEEKGKAWRSCQSIGINSNIQGYCQGIVCNVMDENSLIMYITNGKQVRMLSEIDELKEFKHQVMFNRAMLRLGIVNGKPTISIDRWYPYIPMQITHIYKILDKLCKSNGIQLSLLYNYNSSQMDSDSVTEKLLKEFTLGNHSICMETPNSIPYLCGKLQKDCGKCDIKKQTMCWYCIYNDNREPDKCSTCAWLNKTFCAQCSSLNSNCVSSDCFNCKKVSCSKKFAITPKSQYADNGVIIKLGNEYKLRYDVRLLNKKKEEVI